MKRILLGLLIVLFIGLSVIYYSLHISGSNGFKRNWNQAVIKLTHTRAFDEYVFFAFRPDNNVWLKKNYDPLSLFRLDTMLGDLKVVKIRTPSNFNTEMRNYYFSTINGEIVITNELTQISTPLTNPAYYSVPRLVSDEPAAISQSVLILRGFRQAQLQRYLQLLKLELSGKAKIADSFNIPMQKGTIFSADGKLQYDQESGRLYYLFYHRGAFLCLDTNLKIIYEAKTVDTVTVANIKPVSVSRKNKKGDLIPIRTLSTPPNLVNKYYSIDGEMIYVLSGLRSENQGYLEFKKSSTIDVYMKRNGNYLYSFMIPKYKGILLKQFHVKNDQIFAIYDQYLVTYKF